ncbi:MAG: DUF2569 family protein [Vicinamibacterales bacterium]
MERLTDRLAAWALRLVGMVMLLAGVSVLVAGAASSGMLTGSPVMGTIARILFQLGAVFVVAGAAAIFLSSPGGLPLPNERTATPDAGRPMIGGWLIALAIALVALPVWLVLRLLPFLAEWRRVLDFLVTSDMWKGANSNGAGFVLVPLAGALTPPLFELAAMVAFIVASAVLLLLLLSRSRRFPRIYLVCAVLLSALVFASVRGADAAMAAGGAIEQLMADSSPRAGEDAQLREGLRRYTSIVRSTASALVWTLCGYLVWLPAVLFSRRVRTTFANRAADRVTTSGRTTDIEAITSPPRFPG